MNTHSPKNLELLAPCGSLEAFFAADEAGADAVYCGLKEFSARAKAKNFSLKEVEKMTTYQHNRNKQLYVTINTLIKERELSHLYDTLAALTDIGIDAVITQDLAVWQLCREHFPNLEIHASTQMTIHNSAGAKKLQEMGFTRAVLARELTIDQIAEIRRQSDIELEHFIHGALCFSFSGQCYFSSFVGGKSGNRGKCAQPCRRIYDYRGKEGYYFSANDLSAIDLLPDLTRAGVMSLKIEGRMKSAEYVYKVVSAYRRVLDASNKQRTEALILAKSDLRESFGRQPTKGFMAGPTPENISTPAIKGSTGRMLGRVDSVQGRRFNFKTSDTLKVGDRVRIQPGNDRPGQAFTIKELTAGQKVTGKAKKGQSVQLFSPFPQPFQRGDLVFKVSDASAFSMSTEACRRKLDAEPKSRAPLSLSVRFDGEEMELKALCRKQEIVASYPVEMFPAEKKPLSEDILRSFFEKTDKHPFALAELKAKKLPAMIIPPKQMKGVKREFYRHVEENLVIEQPIRRRPDFLPQQKSRSANEQTTVAIRDLRDAGKIQDGRVDRLIVPLNEQNLDMLGHLRSIDPKQIFFDLPFIIFDEDYQRYRDLAHRASKSGVGGFRLNNLGHFHLIPEGFNGHLIAGYRLFTLNSRALLAWRDLGIDEATLYLEDDRNNMKELVRFQGELPLLATIYHQVPLITSRIQIKGVKGETPLFDKGDNRYRVTKDTGMTKLVSETDFSLIGSESDLAATGLNNQILDLTHFGEQTSMLKRVLAAHRKGLAMEETSTFNYYGELE